MSEPTHEFEWKSRSPQCPICPKQGAMTADDCRSRTVISSVNLECHRFRCPSPYRICAACMADRGRYGPRTQVFVVDPEFPQLNLCALHRIAKRTEGNVPQRPWPVTEPEVLVSLVHHGVTVVLPRYATRIDLENQTLFRKEPGRLRVHTDAQAEGKQRGGVRSVTPDVAPGRLSRRLSPTHKREIRDAWECRHAIGFNETELAARLKVAAVSVSAYVELLKEKGKVG